MFHPKVIMEDHTMLSPSEYEAGLSPATTRVVIPSGYWEERETEYLQLAGTTRHDWVEIDRELKNRHFLLTRSIERIRRIVNDHDVAVKLAATDVFVEKAQHRLTSRATKLMRLGIMTALGTVSLLLGSAWAIYTQSPSEILGVTDSGYVLTIAIIKTISVGSFVGGAVYFWGGLSSALLHESLMLLNRRHALRFGRLSVYLQDGEVDAKMLQEAFQWNDEFPTAFRSINAKELKGGVGSLLEPPSKTINAVTKLVASAKLNDAK